MCDEKLISPQMLNTHHTPKFFFVIGKYINPKLLIFTQKNRKVFEHVHERVLRG